MVASLCALAKAAPADRAPSNAKAEPPAPSASAAASASSPPAANVVPAASAAPRTAPSARPAAAPRAAPAGRAIPHKRTPSAGVREPEIERPLPLPGGRARVHLFVDYPGAWLELRDYVDEGRWRRACFAPCDRVLVVDGMQARVRAPGMSTSNVFRITAGRGTARLRVSGGSAEARTLGIIGLAAGIPVSLAGMGMYGYGVFKQRSAFKVAGASALAVGAVAVLAALPLLVIGSTTVRDARGKAIALELWRGQAGGMPLTFRF